MDDSEVSADLAAQEAAAREYQPQLEVRDCYLSIEPQLHIAEGTLEPN